MVSWLLNVVNHVLQRGTPRFKAKFILFKKPKFKSKEMTTPSAPIEAVSSQRSEEIEPKAGIAIAERQEQFAPNYSVRNNFNSILVGFKQKKVPIA